MSATATKPAEKKTTAKAITKPAKTATPKSVARKAAPAPGPHLVPALTHEQISQRAYEIWANRGYTHGANVQDWWQAEQELKRA